MKYAYDALQHFPPLLVPHQPFPRLRRSVSVPDILQYAPEKFKNDTRHDDLENPGHSQYSKRKKAVAREERIAINRKIAWDKLTMNENLPLHKRDLLLLPPVEPTAIGSYVVTRVIDSHGAPVWLVGTYLGEVCHPNIQGKYYIEHLEGPEHGIHSYWQEDVALIPSDDTPEIAPHDTMRIQLLQRKCRTPKANVGNFHFRVVSYTDYVVQHWRRYYAPGMVPSHVSSSIASPEQAHGACSCRCVQRPAALGFTSRRETLPIRNVGLEVPI